MTFSLDDLKHLEVMAELSNQEPIKQELPNIADLLKEEEVHTPALDENILTLCSKLRATGFGKQAVKLENQFLLYKTAEMHLYKVHSEDGEDLLEFAHPDGDVHIEDAADELGNIETLLSKHKKIMEIMSKEPTGKLASCDIKKKAQDNFFSMQEVSKKFADMADYLDQYVLAKMPQGNKDPQTIAYYNYANDYYELGLKLAKIFDKFEKRRIPDIAQTVKENMYSSIVTQGAQPLTDIKSIDALISHIFLWFSKHNPVQALTTSGSLHKYVNDYLNIVAQTKDLKSEINNCIRKLQALFGEVLTKEELDEYIRLAGGTTFWKSFVNDMASFFSYNEARNHLEAMNESIGRFINKAPTVQLIKTIGFYGAMFDELIDKVDAIDAAKKSMYKSKQGAIWGELAVIRDLIQGANTVIPNTDPKSAELTRLHTWKQNLQKKYDAKQIDKENYDHISTWLTSQFDALNKAVSSEDIAKVKSESDSSAQTLASAGI